MLGRPAHVQADNLQINRLVDLVRRSQTHRLDGGFNGAAGGNDNDLGVGVALPPEP